jgi:predicted phage-related endonuclease
MSNDNNETDDWHAWRRGGIGASDIANAWSGRYGGAYAVVADKLGRLQHKETNERMQRGHRWEQPIADAIQQLTGLHVVGEQTWCEHHQHNRHRCTVDGFLSSHDNATIHDVIAVLEIKTVGRSVSMSWPSWETQTQWQMHVTTVGRALIAAAEIDDTDDSIRRLELRWIERDEVMIRQLRDIADRMLTHVDDGTLPTPDAAALDTVTEVHRQADADAETVDIADLDDQIARWVDLGEQLKRLETERDDITAIVRDRIGAATTGRSASWRVSVSRPMRILTDDGERALLAAHPELGRLVADKTAAKAAGVYDAFTAPVGSRRLTIASHKGKK